MRTARAVKHVTVELEESDTSLMGDFNTSLSSIDKSERMSISKHVNKLNNTAKS